MQTSGLVYISYIDKLNEKDLAFEHFGKRISESVPGFVVEDCVCY